MRLIEMGQATRVHGLKGGFAFRPFNQDGTLLRPGTKVMLRPLGPASCIPEQGQEYTILSASSGPKVVLYLQEVSDRSQSEKIIPFALWLDRKAFPKEEEGEFYLEDLIGLEVFHYESKIHIGKIEAFYEMGSAPVIVIRGEKNLLELPFIDRFFPHIDLPTKQAFVLPPEEYVEV